MSAAASTPATIDTLLRLVPDKPHVVLEQLNSSQQLASRADANGYTLLHAAASYGQLDLLRALTQKYNCDVNVGDDDGETPLFYAETLAAARCLVEELGADETRRNDEELTAEDNALAQMDDGDGGEWALVADFLERRRTGGAGDRAAVQGTHTKETAASAATGDIGDASVDVGNAAGSTSALHAPPPLPPGVKINVGTVQDIPEGGDNDQAGAPDPEFRRRIEELAARDDFQGEDGQAELRRLVTEAVGGMAVGGGSSDNKSRRVE